MSGPTGELLDLESGVRIDELDNSLKYEIIQFVDDVFRPAVLALARAGSGSGPVQRAADSGLREAIESLADGEVIPMSDSARRKTELEGARPLKREEVLAVLDVIDKLLNLQFNRKQQAILAKVVGPKF